jgi:hypothetical protein
VLVSEKILSGTCHQYSHLLWTLLREQHTTIMAENESNIRELLDQKREESRTNLGLRMSQIQLSEVASLEYLEIQDDHNDKEDPEKFIFLVQNIAEQHKLLESYSQFHHDSLLLCPSSCA